MGGYYPITVGTIATRITNAFDFRSALTITNNDVNITAFVGTDASVTPANGTPLAPQIGLSFLRGLGDEPEIEYWGITASGTADLRVLEGYTTPENPKEV